MFDYMGAFLFRSGFAHADNVITKRFSKTITWLFLSRLQGNKPFLNLPKPWNSPPAQTGTLRNLRNLPPEPTPLEPSGTCLRNLHHHTPGLSRTFRNLPPEPSPAHTGALRNLPEPASGTYTSTRRNPAETTPALRNLHQHTPEPSGTFRNLPPEPTPAHTGTLRNLPEPSSGTCSCDPHRHTPELIWAEDPISLRCWGITPPSEKRLETKKNMGARWTKNSTRQEEHLVRKKIIEAAKNPQSAKNTDPMHKTTAAPR